MLLYTDYFFLSHTLHTHPYEVFHIRLIHFLYFYTSSYKRTANKLEMNLHIQKQGKHLDRSMVNKRK